MSRKKVTGTCKICGTHGKLSFEHVPPESAFNKGKFHFESDIERLNKMDEDFPDDYISLNFNRKHRYVRKKQGGIGFYTLCERCNNLTGKWYGSSYVDYAHQALAILLKSNGQPTLYYPTYFFPLRVIKQVITMFFSLKYLGFNERFPELVKFLLNKETRFLPDKIKVYSYYNFVGANRYLGDQIVGDFNNGQQKIMELSELTFPPFGFVLTIDSVKPDNRLTDISYFANYAYNDWTDFYSKLTPLPTHLPMIPGDYRTREEIVEAIHQGRAIRDSKYDNTH